MAFNLLTSLKKRYPVRLTAIILNRGMLSAAVERLGITTVVIEESKASFLRVFLRLRDVVRDISPQIIHSHRYKENLLAYLVSSLKSRPRLVATQHGMPERYTTAKRPLISLKERTNYWIISRKFDKAVAVSHEMKDSLITQHGLNKSKLRVIHNGIEIPENIQPKSNGIPFAIGSAGRFTPVKDYPLLIEVARQVALHNKAVVFKLAGDGPERSKLQSMIEDFNLEGSFHFEGFIKDMADFYSGLDLYLNTSLHEGIPLTILEAMAHQLPVVAPKVGGIKEIVEDGVHGYLLPNRDPAAFAEKCLALICDKALRNRMAVASRGQVCERFSADRMAADYFSIYEEVLGK